MAHPEIKTIDAAAKELHDEVKAHTVEKGKTEEVARKWTERSESLKADVKKETRKAVLQATKNHLASLVETLKDKKKSTESAQAALFEEVERDAVEAQKTIDEKLANPVSAVEETAPSRADTPQDVVADLIDSPEKQKQLDAQDGFLGRMLRIIPRSVLAGAVSLAKQLKGIVASIKGAFQQPGAGPATPGAAEMAQAEVASTLFSTLADTIEPFGVAVAQETLQEQLGIAVMRGTDDGKALRALKDEFKKQGKPDPSEADPFKAFLASRAAMYAPAVEAARKGLKPGEQLQTTLSGIVKNQKPKAVEAKPAVTAKPDAKETEPKA